MVSPGDNMAQTDPYDGDDNSVQEYIEGQSLIEPVPGEEWLKFECVNCGHERRAHLHRDGCLGIDKASSDPKVGVINRCHCTNFEVKE